MASGKSVKVDVFTFGNSEYYKLSPVRGRSDLSKQRFHRHKLHVAGAHGYKTRLSAEARRDVWGGVGRGK